MTFQDKREVHDERTSPCFGCNRVDSIIRSIFTTNKEDALQTQDEDASMPAPNGNEDSKPIHLGISEEEQAYLMELRRKVLDKKQEDSSDFMSVLVQCATELEIQRSDENSRQEEQEFSLDDHPEEQIRMLLAQEKKKEAETKRRKDFCNRVEQTQNLNILPISFEVELQKVFAQSKHDFLISTSQWLGRRGTEALVDVAFRALSADCDSQEAKDLVDWFYRLAIACHLLELDDFTEFESQSSILSKEEIQKPMLLTESLLRHCGKHNKSVSKTDFLEWQTQNFPKMAWSPAALVQMLLFPSMHESMSAFNIPQSDTHFFPTLDQTSEFFTSPLSELSYALTQSANLGPKWHRLYSTAHDGLSFDLLQRGIFGYAGPTLFLVRAYRESAESSQSIFGAYASTPWKKQADGQFFGDSECFLFTLYPTLSIMRATNDSRGGRFQYLGPKGIGLGGSTAQPRFCISPSLEQCYAGSSDWTFQHGNLGNNEWVEMECLELWGVGNDQSMKQYEKYRTVQESHLNKARQVNKAAFLNDFRSGLIESKMFDFRQQMRDRDGGCLLDFVEEE